nr:GspH/FimT family pseudopilin [Pseudomonas sp. dw_358]
MRGFTLLEMLAVMLIMAVGMSLLASSINHGLSAARDRQAGRDLTLALRTARSQAISQGRAVYVRLDILDKRFQISGAPVQSLPTDMTIRATTAAGQVPHEAVFAFYPDGASSGGNVYLEREDRAWRIDVAWLTGMAVWHEITPL